MSEADSSVLLTPDGSRTALSRRFGEAYGSRHGAATQAHHVFLEGTETHLNPAPRVLEIGFGMGLNFRATLANTARRGAALSYLAYEFDPAPVGVLRDVAQDGEGAAQPLWQKALAAWPTTGEQSELHVQEGGQQLTVWFEDVLSADLPRKWATALYLDGFSPSRNPEVWTPDFVARLAGALEPGGILATYSAAGHVRRAMQAAGLRVERRPGAPGKRECLRAIKVSGEQSSE